MYRFFSSLGEQRQCLHRVSRQLSPTLAKLAGLHENCRPRPSLRLELALTRSLASSSRIKPPHSQHSHHLSTASIPITPAASTPTLTVLPIASVSSLVSSVLQPVFGRHSTPVRLLSLLSFVFLCHLLVFDLFTGHGPSMLPTFALSGEVFLVEAISRYTLLAATAAAEAAAAGTSESAPSLSMFARVLSGLFTIARGDVVLCGNPVRPQHSIAKRVIGLPGDLVRASLHEPDSLCCVPAGHVWLQGDCLEASRDSREYGAVPLELVRGKVVARVWPMSRATWIERTLQHRGC